MVTMMVSLPEGETVAAVRIVWDSELAVGMLVAAVTMSVREVSFFPRRAVARTVVARATTKTILTGFMMASSNVQR
jgi:hypothetical protein